MRRESLSAGPLTDSRGLAPEALNETAGRLRRQGIRLLPFPFGSALAIVSDIDSSSREPYRGYVGMLVDELGLDFGDSAWLRWQDLHGSGDAFTRGLGFFSRHLALGRSEEPHLYKTTHTFNESVAEFHKGNVDHFHSFLPRGPRVVVPPFSEVSDRCIQAPMPDFETTGPWVADSVFVFGVCIVGRPGATLSVDSVVVTDRLGQSTDRYRPASFPAPNDGRNWRYFLLDSSPEEEEPVPELSAVSKVTVRFSSGCDPASVQRVLLTDANGKLIIDRLKYLRDRFNVEVSLITEHSGLHFRNPPRGRWQDAQLKEHMERPGRLAAAYNGNINDENGELIFATDSEHPQSFGRVFPELTRDLGCRYVVPAAASKAFGWHPLELLSASPTMSGGGIYWARRMLPNLSTPEHGRRFDGTRSRRDTFAARISRILEYTEAEPGLFYPIYTHLGRGADGDHVRKAERPTPESCRGTPASAGGYFEQGPLHALQDRAYNISGKTDPPSRIWVTRASVLYDYALMLQNIADHVTRPDPDTVRITSWFDGVLGRMLPVSPTQLYGVTFYVDDPIAARVFLDDRPIDLLIRNPRDETGRASVTIAESAIRFVVFEQLDPCKGRAIELRSARWNWNPAQAEEKAFGRLQVVESGDHSLEATDGQGLASVRVPMHGWSPGGAQAMTFAVRTSGDARFGIILETESGGIFQIGDGSLLDRLRDDATATRRLQNQDRSAKQWTTLTIPFWDLGWAPGAVAGGPLPNHALHAISIFCLGPTNATVDLAQMAFLRPRAPAVATPDTRRYCVCGSASPYTKGQRVQTLRLGDGVAEPISVAVDQRGCFCFDRLEPGIYRLWSDTPDGPCFDRRGPLLEVNANVTGVRLQANITH